MKTEAERIGSKGRRLLGLAVFALAFLIRLPGITWGLPDNLHNQSFHPDEYILYKYVAAIDPSHLKLTPGQYNYPSFYPLLVRVSSSVTTSLAGVKDPAGQTPPEQLDDTQRSQRADYIRVVTITGRIISALAGAGTVLLVFLILRRFVGSPGDFFGAAMLAIAPAWLVHSRFQTVDVMATFLASASFFFALNLLRREGETSSSAREDLRNALLSGVMAGLATSTKYPVIVVFLAVWAALLVRRHPNTLKLGGLATALGILAFGITTPGVFLEWPLFQQGFSFEIWHSSTGHEFLFLNTPPGYIFQIENLMAGVGAISIILGIAGLLVAAVRKHQWAWVALAFFIPYYILIGRAEVKFLRYAFPLLPPIACGFGFAVGALSRRKGMMPVACAAGALALIGVEGPTSGLRGAIQYTQWMMGTDPREAAALYLKEKAAADPNLVVGLIKDPWYYTPPLFPDTGMMAFVPMAQRDAFVANVDKPKVVVAVQGQRPPYITYSSFEVNSIRRLKDSPDVPIELLGQISTGNNFLDGIDRDYNLDRTFGGGTPDIEDLMYVQPTIWVFKRKDLP